MAVQNSPEITESDKRKLLTAFMVYKNMGFIKLKKTFPDCVAFCVERMDKSIGEVKKELSVTDKTELK
jgi:hypothetical protein